MQARNRRHSRNESRRPLRRRSRIARASRTEPSPFRGTRGQSSCLFAALRYLCRLFARERHVRRNQAALQHSLWKRPFRTELLSSEFVKGPTRGTLINRASKKEDPIRDAPAPGPVFGCPQRIASSSSMPCPSFSAPTTPCRGSGPCPPGPAFPPRRLGLRQHASQAARRFLAGISGCRL